MINKKQNCNKQYLQPRNSEHAIVIINELAETFKKKNRITLKLFNYKSYVYICNCVPSNDWLLALHK